MKKPQQNTSGLELGEVMTFNNNNTVERDAIINTLINNNAINRNSLPNLPVNTSSSILIAPQAQPKEFNFGSADVNLSPNLSLNQMLNAHRNKIRAQTFSPQQPIMQKNKKSKPDKEIETIE